MRTVCCVLVAALALAAQEGFEYWPGASYDARIPTYRSVLGYDAGSRIATHAELVRYLEALAEASPRLRVFDYGRTWQGRRLVYAALGSEANLRRLPEIRAAMARLADPRKTPPEEARKLIAGLPVVVWLSAGVHGNEISSPEAALLVCHHLLAARQDRMVDQVLANVLLLVAPLQNPDGRDRFIHHFEQHRGLEPDPSPLAAERNESWPGGRSNHYLFDMNRDWIALTQPEIRNQVKAILEWFPQVSVDLHEMSGDSTYFFAPDPDPLNPHLTQTQRESLAMFGKNNARWFDRFGIDYFTREIFDGFYPGYGASWPAYHGAISMTYEQTTARGLVRRRGDGRLLRFRDSIRHHFIASLATAENAARHREKLLGDFYAYRASAVEEGRREAVKEYILPRGRDASATDKLAWLLAVQGVEVERATAAFRNAGREFPAGTYVVRLAQPAKRLIRTLLDPHVPMDDPFITAEEKRRRAGQPSQIYDVTAWSLPLMFNVEAVAAAEVSAGEFQPAGEAPILPGEVRGKAGVAYLAPWGSAAAGRLLAAALRQDLRVHSSDKPFTLDGAGYPSGTLIFKVRDNPPDLHERLAALARSTGAEIHAAAGSWVEDGVNFGSRNVVHVRKPAVAMAWDTPVAGGAAGATRFVIERQYGYPVTVIRTRQLARADLGDIHVLILPPGGDYARELGPAGIRRVKEWVAAGGTLVAAGEAVSFLTRRDVQLLSANQEDLYREGQDKKPAAAQNEPARAPGTILASQAEYLKAIAAERRAPDRVPGVLVRARLDPEHWITAGMGETVTALFSGAAIYTPIKLDKGVNAALFESADKLVASGYMWEENRRQLAFKPLLMVQPEGRGNVVAFTADPNFRAYLDGLNILFLNAIFRGPAHTRLAGM